ncbi:hypothetical protein AXG93_3661s1090 [Marchantia polymorpha subsp. ruderalis]|uniref:Uncharacterized protein n=1 Tax=Marchantia polymorpha subsp. ruderalis TaxID=1480154 RepID=A0A176VJJ5_MARPO|nr:hypothetical protein AXG93_3661s1090 [Marchantia polymorpha subsp. ruderalis]
MLSEVVGSENVLKAACGQQSLSLQSIPSWLWRSRGARHFTKPSSATCTCSRHAHTNSLFCKAKSKLLLKTRKADEDSETPNMAEQMDPSYSEKKNQNTLQRSETYQSMMTTAYESISSSYILQLGCFIVLMRLLLRVEAERSSGAKILALSGQSLGHLGGSGSELLIANLCRSDSLWVEVDEEKDLIQRATLDAIGKVAFGVDFPSLPSALPKLWPHIAFASDLDTTIAVKRFSDPFWELKRYMNIGTEMVLPEQMQVVDGFTFSLIADRKAELKHLHGQVYDLAQAYLAHASMFHLSHILLSELLQLVAPAPCMRVISFPNYDERLPRRQPQTDELLRHILINFVIASRDAIGVTLTWLVYELSMHSDASHILYLELRDYESRRQFECQCSVEQYWDVDLQDEDYVRMMDTRIREFAALIVSGLAAFLACLPSGDSSASPGGASCMSHEPHLPSSLVLERDSHLHLCRPRVTLAYVYDTNRPGFQGS